MSISTGQELRRYETEVTFRVPRDDDLMAALGDEEARVVAIVDDGQEVACSAKVLSSSYTQDDDRRHYRIELQEIEHLDLENLVVAGHELRPHKYAEEIRHEVLTCLVRARIPKETLSTFWAMRGARRGEEYFDVVRHGITDEPRRMRFGRILWTDRGDAGVEALFVLVDKACDDDPKNQLRIHGPNEGAVQESVAKLEVVMERLLATLGVRSVISADEIDAVRSVSDELAHQRELNYHEVSDLDKWD